MRKSLLFILLSICITASYATTWDEPWQEEIIEQSEYFVYGAVISASDSLVEVEVKKSFGKTLSGTIMIDGFFMLDLCSVSGGHGPEFYVQSGEEGYFFLKKGENGAFKIPTPTSGFDRIVDGKVHATFRHTYHQAALSPEIYEMAYEVIWNKKHHFAYDQSGLDAFIDKYLAMEPAGFEAHEIDVFFNQHVALESAYLIHKHIASDVLKKFVKSDNFHARVSALRAIQFSENEDIGSLLLAYIKNVENDNFTKVIAIWSAWNRGDKVIKEGLLNYQDKLSDEIAGFGGNIMDPRVCTHFPSPKQALAELTESTD